MPIVVNIRHFEVRRVNCTSTRVLNSVSMAIPVVDKQGMNIARWRVVRRVLTTSTGV